MLYNWLYPFHTAIFISQCLSVIRAFRIIYAAVTAFLIAFVLAPWVIRKLQEIKLGQQIRDDGPKRIWQKAERPPWAGFSSFLPWLSTLLWADITDRYVWLVLVATVGFGAIGFADDYLKFIKLNRRGCRRRKSSLLKYLVALIVALFLYMLPSYTTKLSVPFFKNLHARSWLVLCRLRRSGHRRQFECRESDGWPRWAGHWPGHDCRVGLYHCGLCHRSSRDVGISA